MNEGGQVQGRAMCYFNSGRLYFNSGRLYFNSGRLYFNSGWLPGF